MSERIEQLKKRESKYVQTLFSQRLQFHLLAHDPEVKESGLLDLISIQEYKLQEAMFEVITSEASYLRSLTIAVSHFSKCPEMLDMLTLTGRHTLFSNLQEVKDTSERLLLDLEERLGKNLLLTDISDIVLWHSADFRRVYIPYVTSQMYQEKMIQQLVLSEEFVQVLKELEAHPICQQQLLKSFLMLPFQRITRLKIMLENILMLNPPESPVADSVRGAFCRFCPMDWLEEMSMSCGKALHQDFWACCPEIPQHFLQAMENPVIHHCSIPLPETIYSWLFQIIHECNENVKRMRQIEELVSLEKQMEFSRTKSFRLISQTRFLVKEDELDEISVFESGHTTGSPTRSVYLHLFNDLLLLSRKDNGRFSVLDYARIWKVRAHCFEAKSLVFALCLVENHKGTNRNFIVGAGNEKCRVLDCHYLKRMKQSVELSVPLLTIQLWCSLLNLLTAETW